MSKYRDLPAPPAARTTAADIQPLLRAWCEGQGYTYFAELRIGTGQGANAERTMDGWAMHVIPSRAAPRMAFEIKTSRADFLVELKEPLKRRGAMQFSNEFYFVTPGGLIAAGEIPMDCGLIECDAYGARKTVAAPYRESLPTWRFVASIVRRVSSLDR